MFQLLLCNYYNVFNMSKSCSGLLKDLVHCLRESECFQVRRLGAFFRQHDALAGDNDDMSDLITCIG